MRINNELFNDFKQEIDYVYVGQDSSYFPLLHILPPSPDTDSPLSILLSWRWRNSRSLPAADAIVVPSPPLVPSPLPARPIF